MSSIATSADRRSWSVDAAIVEIIHIPIFITLLGTKRGAHALDPSPKETTSPERTIMSIQEAQTVSNPIDLHTWHELSKDVPSLADLRTRSRDQGLPPTAVLFTLLAQIGLYLPVGVRMQEFDGKDRVPITSYVVLLGKPAAGKSSTNKWVSLIDQYDHICPIDNPVSGQTIAAEFLHHIAKPKTNDDPPVKLPEYLRKPHGLINYDEGQAFDAAANSTEHGEKFRGMMNSAWLAELQGINQSAATEKARRILPAGSQVSITATVMAQPQTCGSVLEDITGFGSRWLVCYVSPSEYRHKFGTRRSKFRPLLEDWQPLDYPDGYVPFAENVESLVEALAEYAKSVGEELDPEDAAIVKTIDDCFIEMIHRGYLYRHTVLKFMKIASSLAVYERSPSVEMRHLYAAELLLSYSIQVSEDYAKYLEVVGQGTEDEAFNKRGRSMAVARNAAISFAEEYPKIARKAADKTQAESNGSFTKSPLYENLFKNKPLFAGSSAFVNYCLSEGIIAPVQGEGKVKRYQTVEETV